MVARRRVNGCHDQREHRTRSPRVRLCSDGSSEVSFNPKRLVADGYNRIAEEYSTLRGPTNGHDTRPSCLPDCARWRYSSNSGVALAYRLRINSRNDSP